jgi:hypothetical protein
VPDGSTPEGSSSDSTTGDAPANDGSSTFDVAALPGLVLWLDASKGVVAQGTNAVGTWKDQSPKGNDVTLFAGTSSLVASLIHGYPAVALPPSSALRGPQGSTDFTWGTDDFLVEGVTIMGSGNGTLLTCANIGGFGASLGVLMSDAWASVGDGTLPAVQVQTMSSIAAAPHVLGLRRTPGIVDLRVDGASMTGTATTAANVHGIPVIGGGVVAVAVAELIVVHGTTSPKDLAGPQGYLEGTSVL